MKDIDRGFRNFGTPGKDALTGPLALSFTTYTLN